MAQTAKPSHNVPQHTHTERERRDALAARRNYDSMEKQQHDHTEWLMHHHSESWSSIWCTLSCYNSILRVCNCNGYYLTTTTATTATTTHTLQFNSIPFDSIRCDRKNHEPQPSLEFPLFTHREYWSFCHLLTSHLLPFFHVAVALVLFYVSMALLL